MSAGRSIGYRSSGSDSDVSRIGYANSDYNRRSKGREYEKVSRSGVRDNLESRYRVTQKRDVTNGGYLSTVGSGNTGGVPRVCDFAVRTVDREPGELSSDDSDEAIDSDAAVNKEIECKELRNGNHLSPVQSKRMKFSPVVLDRDGRNVRKIIVSRQISETFDLPPPPIMAKSYSQSPKPNLDSDANVQSLLSDDSEVCLPNPDADGQSLLSDNTGASEASPSKHDPLPDLPDKPTDISSLPLDESSLNGTRAIDDYDDMPTTRTITSSRWANDADSLSDEGEISDFEDIKILKWKSGSGSAQTSVRKSISPELGEVREESSTGARARSSESDEHVGSSIRVTYLNNDDKNDYMEIDDGHYDDSGASQSDPESNDKFGALGTPEPIRPLQRSVNMLQGCRSVDEFERLNKINEGTYGVVYRARDKKTGEIVALKKVKMEREREGFPLTALREINILLSFHHPSIVDVKEVVVGNSLDSIFMAMEYMEHDLKGLMETIRQPFSQSEVKCLMLQLLSGTKYLHDNWVLHRDLKTSNLLLNNSGELKICDFGLARQYGSPLKPYTQLVVTLWYRAPELLLGAKQYSTAIDMWSLGCIMAELLLKEPLFSGKSELDQLDKIFRVLGTPNEAIWPGCTKLPAYRLNLVKNRYNLLRKKFPATSFTGCPVLSDAGFDLLTKLLTYDPEQRITAEEALKHEWFCEVPLPKSREFMPTFPAQNVQDRRLRTVVKSPDPLKAQQRKELQQEELGTGGGLFGQ